MEIKELIEKAREVNGDFVLSNEYFRAGNVSAALVTYQKGKRLYRHLHRYRLRHRFLRGTCGDRRNAEKPGNGNQHDRCRRQQRHISSVRQMQGTDVSDK